MTQNQIRSVHGQSCAGCGAQGKRAGKGSAVMELICEAKKRGSNVCEGADE